MKFVPDSEGWYHQGNGYPPSRLCPTDTTDLKAWADSILMRAKNVIKYGLGNVQHDGKPYPLMDFVYDTLGGDMPHHSEMHRTVCSHILACTEYNWVMSEFYRIYGIEYFPVDPEELIKELDQC